MFDKNDFENLGNKCKAEEGASSVVLDGSRPWIMRLDGRAFHTFTRGLERPFDKGYRQCMVDAMIALANEFRPNLAYQQSDEITLAFLVPPKTGKNRLFGMRLEKLCSIGGSTATLAFHRAVRSHLPHKSDDNALFDCRVYNTDDPSEHILWRQMDCVRNSVMMAAQAEFGHKQLHGVSHGKALDMLAENGLRWSEREAWEKYGTFARKVTVERFLTDEEMLNIPEKFRPIEKVKRGEIELFSKKFSPEMLTLSLEPLED